MILKEILKYIGIDLNGISGGGIPIEGLDVNAMLYNLSLMVFIFSVISFLSVLNIIIYFIIIIYSDNSKFVLNMSNKRPWFGKFIKYYKSSRLSLIVIEFLFFVFSTGGMVFISFIILTKCFV
jgi:hypothetical protein